MLEETSSGLDIYNILLENCSAVVVLPHHLGPSIRRAPFPLSFLLTKSSVILGLYLPINSIIYHIWEFGKILVVILSYFYLGSWRFFNRRIGLIYKLDEDPDEKGVGLIEYAESQEKEYIEALLEVINKYQAKRV